MTPGELQTRTLAPRSLTTSHGVVTYTRGGSGARVLCLHDIASSRHSFDALADLLRPAHQVIQIDLLGHGDSDSRPQDLGLQVQYEALLEVVSDLSVDGLTLVGHSFGGSVALKLAAHHPELVRRIVLVSAGTYDYQLPVSWRLFSTRPGWRLLRWLGGSGRVARALRKANVAPGLAPQLIDPLETRPGWNALGRALRQALDEETLGELEHIVEHGLRHPLLVIWGTENQILPIGTARVLFQGRPGVRFVEITGAGHAAHEEAPGVVADLVREVCES